MQKSIHVNLTSKQFPIDFRELSSTIVRADIFEQNRQLLQGFIGEGAEQSYGLSQAYFMQNVLPTVRGYASVHYENVLPAADGFSAVLDRVFVLQNSANQAVLYSPANNLNMIYDPADGFWKTQLLSAVDNTGVSVTDLKQAHYICIPNVGLFQYNFSTGLIEELTVVGISFDGVLGVTSANGQLVLWTASQLYWSSVLDPLDFTPSTATGAGATSVLALKGAIILCLKYAAGFIIYTSLNAIHASPTNSTVFPWAFLEIKDSVGIASADHVSRNSTQSNHIAWTGSGFMAVQPTGYKPIWPELSEAASKGLFVFADAEGNPFISAQESVDVKITTIGSKYLCISFREDGIRHFSHAYIYDIVLARWGRLDVPHVGFFEFSDPKYTVIQTYEEFGETYLRYGNIPGEPFQYAELGIDLEFLAPRAGDNFGLIAPDASVFLVKFATRLFPNPLEPGDRRGHTAAGAAEPKILFGRFKVSRDRGVKIQQIKYERDIDSDLKAFGHDEVGSRVLYKDSFTVNPSMQSIYYGGLVGDSVSIGINGVFSIKDLTIVVADAGSRNLPVNPPSARVIVEESFVQVENSGSLDVVSDPNGVVEE